MRILFFLLLLSACSSVNQVLDPNVFYKRDIEIEVNGQKREGVSVTAKAESYNIILRPKADLDLVLLKTCHREFTGEKLSSGFLSSKAFKYNYVPMKGIEDLGSCPLRIDVFESGKGRHSWAMLDFESPDLTIKGKMTCNGFEVHFSGVSICQGKAETTQRVEFTEAVRFAPSNCDAPDKISEFIWDFHLSFGECLFYFDNKQGNIGRITTIGYSGVLVREGN